MASTDSDSESPSALNDATSESSSQGNILSSSHFTSRCRSRNSISARTELLQPAVANLLSKHAYNFVLSDPRQPDNPIVYVSEGFYQLTGYSAEEVLGKNCRFLQGPETDRQTVMEIRDAIREERSCHVKILNYTKSGQPFWNLFHLTPVFSSEDGRVLHFVGVQTPIAGDGDEGRMSDAHENLSKETDQVLRRVEAEGVGRVEAGGVGLRSRGDSRSFFGDLARGEVSGELEEEGVWGSGRGEGHAGGHLDMADGEEPSVGAELKSRAATALRAILTDLTARPQLQLSCRREKGMDFASAAAKGVVCSSLVLALARIHQSFVLADPHLPDCPIVHVSEVFMNLTGYTREEVVGRNCRFLQGPDTDPEAIKEVSTRSEYLRKADGRIRRPNTWLGGDGGVGAQIRAAVDGERACTVRILNYRKSGAPFWNSFHVAPIRCSDGQVAFFCGVQLDIEQAAKMEERGAKVVGEGLGVGGGGGSQKGGLSSRLQQLGVVGAVRVAVRGLQGPGLRRRVGG